MWFYFIVFDGWSVIGSLKGEKFHFNDPIEALVS